MCVWSAYAGKKPAAPVLLEALKKTEGFWAGFYTGMATCDNGQLFFEKCTGYTGIFEKEYDLKLLPGTTGIIHSRTDSGGGANRAHPFVGTEKITALISQGTLGVFTPLCSRAAEVARRLYDDGRRLRSGSSNDGVRPNPQFIMPDGNQVSFSDVVVNEIEREYMLHGDIVKAMRQASGFMLEESCSICIFADKPGVIGFINMNQRVGYSFEKDGVYMGTTMEAFPGTFMEIPGNSVGYVTADGVFHREQLCDAEINSAVPGGIITAITGYLKEHPGALLGHICDNAVRPLFVPNDLDLRTVILYRAMETMLKEGMIRFETVITPGGTGVDGRIFKWYLQDA